MERMEIIRRLLARREVSVSRARPKSLQGRCWNWIAASNGDGYGQMRIERGVYYTHRISAHLWLGMPLDSPLNVRHRCIGNSKCFNPRHLQLGTITENNRDLVLQGRHGNSARVRLTDNEVKAMIRRVRSGKQSIGKWSSLNGISYSTVRRAYLAISHSEIAIAAHAVCDSQGYSLENPLLRRSTLPAVLVPKGCKVDGDGNLIVVNARLAGIDNDESMAIAMNLPF